MLSSVINDKHLIDTFRVINGDATCFTWRKPNTIQQGRLDFFLTTNDFSQFIRKSEIHASYKSDHSPITLELNFSKIEHGKGLWKFNNSLLYDLEYIQCIKQKIEEIKQQYVLPVYNIEYLNTIENDLIQFTINDQLFLETLLMEIRGKTISYSSFKSKKRKEREYYILKAIEDIEKQLTNENIEELNLLQQELIGIRNLKMKGAFIRAKAKWIDEGEKPSKYFCNLEAQYASNKNIPFIENDEGQRLFDNPGILKEAAQFYKTLYTKSVFNDSYNVHDDLKGINTIKLNTEQSQSLEGLLTLKEILITLKNMKHDKSPGSDGFTAEF